MRPIQLADRFMTPLTLRCYEACGYRGVHPTSTVTLISHVVSKWGSKVVPLPPLRLTKHELDKDKQFSRAAVKRQDCAYLRALHPCNGEGIPLPDCVGGIPCLRKWFCGKTINNVLGQLLMLCGQSASHLASFLFQLFRNSVFEIMTAITTVHAGPVAAHAAPRLLLIVSVSATRQILSFRIHVSPEPPRVVAPVVLLPYLVTYTILYSFALLLPLAPVATPGFPQLKKNTLPPAPRNLPDIRSPALSLCWWTSVHFGCASTCQCP